MSPKAALLSYLNPFAEQAQEVAGSEALGQRVFGDAPTEELQKIRDDARLVGGVAGLGEMLTAKGATKVAGGIEDFMQFLPNVRAQAVTPEGSMLPLPDDTLPDTSITEILAGRNSTTGPAKEKIAKELRNMGKNEDEIFRATQAYFDSDVLGMDVDAFRHEIPNTEKSTLKTGDFLYSKNENSFGFKPDVQRYEYDPDAEDLFLNDLRDVDKIMRGEKGFGDTPTLGQVFDFPELFKEYPQLRDVYVVGVEAPNIKVGGETKQLGGFYLHDGVRGKPTIAMAQATNARDFQSSLLHEIQHAVQAVENTPGGGEFMSIYNSLKERLGVEGDSDYVMGRAINVYEALYGEIEARVVQQRFLNPELKKETPVATRKREAADTDIVVDETDAVDTIDDAIREELEYGDVDYEEVYPNQFQASLTTAPIKLRDDTQPPFTLEDGTFPKYDFTNSAPEGSDQVKGFMSAFDMIHKPTGTRIPADSNIRGHEPDFEKAPGIPDFDSETARRVMMGEISLDDARKELVRKSLKVVDKAEGGIVSLLDVARNTGRGPRGVSSLAPVARNMTRPMVS